MQVLTMPSGVLPKRRSNKYSYIFTVGFNIKEIHYDFRKDLQISFFNYDAIDQFEYIGANRFFSGYGIEG